MSILDRLNLYDLKKVAGTNGGEYMGPCPWCGGTDRFRVWPDKDRYWCRQCGKSGDSIQYLRDYKGLTYKDACQALNIEPRYTYRPLIRKQKPTWTPREINLPEQVWQNKAKSFLDWSQKQMWADQGKDTLRFLNDRGLRDETIKKAGLGWNPKDYWMPRETWGLEPVRKDNGKLKKLWIPEGLIIPCILDGDIIRLRIRRPTPEEGPRYYLIPGSDTRAMILGADKTAVVVVESELDAILLHQEAGDLINVISLGNAQTRPDKTAHEILDRADVILVALDSDQAGAKESWQWWNTHYKQSLRWPCIQGKDLGEMYQAGEDIRLWIRAGLPEAGHEEPKIKNEHETMAGENMRQYGTFPEEWEQKFDFDEHLQKAIQELDGLGLSYTEIPEHIRRKVHHLENQIDQAARKEDREAFVSLVDEWKNLFLNRRPGNQIKIHSRLLRRDCSLTWDNDSVTIDGVRYTNKEISNMNKARLLPQQIRAAHMIKQKFKGKIEGISSHE